MLAWLKKWGAWLLAGIGVLLGAGWLWRLRDEQLGRLKDKAIVNEARVEIAKLQGMRDQLTERLEDNDQAIQDIDRSLAENKRKLIEAYEYGQELSDEEVEAAFIRLLGR